MLRQTNRWGMRRTIRRSPRAADPASTTAERHDAPTHQSNRPWARGRRRANLEPADIGPGSVRHHHIELEGIVGIGHTGIASIRKVRPIHFPMAGIHQNHLTSLTRPSPYLLKQSEKTTVTAPSASLSHPRRRLTSPCLQHQQASESALRESSSSPDSEDPRGCVEHF